MPFWNPNLSKVSAATARPAAGKRRRLLVVILARPFFSECLATALPNSLQLIVVSPVAVLIAQVFGLPGPAAYLAILLTLAWLHNFLRMTLKKALRFWVGTSAFSLVSPAIPQRPPVERTRRESNPGFCCAGAESPPPVVWLLGTADSPFRAHVGGRPSLPPSRRKEERRMQRPEGTPTRKGGTEPPHGHQHLMGHSL